MEDHQSEDKTSNIQQSLARNWAMRGSNVECVWFGEQKRYMKIHQNIIVRTVRDPILLHLQKII